MRTLKALAVSGLMAISIIAATSAHAAPASASATATADIIEPIGIQNLDINGVGIQFGSIIPLGGGWVTIAPSNARTFGGVDVVPSSPATAGKFLVTGHTGNTFSISLPATTTITSGANSMTVSSFTSNPLGSGILVPGGTNLNVGASLAVPAGQPVGHYAGSFIVTVAYN